MLKKTNQQIAIDGPAASGKSTVAKDLASRLRGKYVNSGDLYRTISWLALKNNLDPSKGLHDVLSLIRQVELRFQMLEKISKNELILCLNGVPVDRAQIRSPEVTKVVSFLAKEAEIRANIIDIQREVKSFGLIVMDGRDIGTVIFPKAEFKFFLNASPEERAKRRLRQGGETFDGATLQTVTDEILKRDKLDREREIAPLRLASSAHEIDSTNLSIDQTVNRILGYIHGPPDEKVKSEES